MNPHLVSNCARLGLASMVLAFTLVATPSPQPYETELGTIAGSVATAIKDSGRKKVTILDFTDLQGSQNELGRFLAEQISVNLVMSRKDFSVIDRANLKTILAEHKLTFEGLVEPENVKKLGKFSGVDAIILGSMTPLKDEVLITAKVIATDTAEIIGATLGKITRSKEIEELLVHSFGASLTAQTIDSTTKTTPLVRSKPPASGRAQQFGNLAVTLVSLQGQGRNDAEVLVDLALENTSASASIAVALHCSSAKYLPDTEKIISSLVASDGTEYWCGKEELMGVSYMNANPSKLTQIGPGENRRISLKYKSTWGHSGNVFSFRLMAELIVCSPYSDTQYERYTPRPDILPPSCKISNLVLDIPVKPLKAGS